MTLLLVLLGVVIAAVLAVVAIYNNLVALRQAVESAWSQIDVQLKRRYDLIPNLIETVKGYMAHEKQTLESVVQARSQAMQAGGIAEKAQAETALTQSLRGLLAVVERYPDLKANTTMATLQQELATTENRIAMARQVYNENVMRYNTAVSTIPSNLVASLGGFKPAEFFAIEEPSQRQAPIVKF